MAKVGYHFELTSEPAEHFQYRYQTGTENTGGVYDAMSDSAFEDFRRVLISRFGLQPKHLEGP